MVNLPMVGLFLAIFLDTVFDDCPPELVTMPCLPLTARPDKLANCAAAHSMVFHPLYVPPKSHAKNIAMAAENNTATTLPNTPNAPTRTYFHTLNPSS
jgi:hypothetical protein